MNEHEKLLNICNKIWYKPIFWFQREEEDEYNEFTWFYEYYKWPWYTRKVDVREIIFTQPFMDKLREAMIERWYQETWYEFHMMQLVTRYLKDPVDYLDYILKDE